MEDPKIKLDGTETDEEIREIVLLVADGKYCCTVCSGCGRYTIDLAAPEQVDVIIACRHCFAGCFP